MKGKIRHLTEREIFFDYFNLKSYYLLGKVEEKIKTKK